MHLSSLLPTLLLLLLPSTTLSNAASLRLRSITWNIRFATTTPGTNEKPWSTVQCPTQPNQCRMPHVQSLLSKASSSPSTSNPTIIGLQEVLSNQLSDVKSGLGPAWAHIGVGRNDGVAAGEFSPILYRKDTFRVLFSETKWLSPTPDVPSYGWGAAHRRIVTIGVFEHIATGKRFLAANTHLDDVSSLARTEGIKVAVARIEAARAMYGNSLGVILTGDFNSEPDDDAYEALKGLRYLTEVWETGATRLGSYKLTFTGFTTTGVSRIDYCWVGPVGERKVTVQQFEIWGNVVGGVIASDHRAVVTDLTIV
ncbi:hypothetical protein IFR05_009446 [Cadophora sp. M221]|nr:hypothetical protein IFR05_009446 [Cadophora sp. M221]